MLDEESFVALIKEIQAQGYDRNTAGRYAVLIGDTPTIDEEGKVVVMDGNKEVARIRPLRFFGME